MTTERPTNFPSWMRWVEGRLRRLDARVAAAGTGWVAPVLLNSWVNAGAPSAAAGYMRRDGIVYLKGFIINGTNGFSAFILPAGFRPAEARLFFQTTTTGGRTQVRSDGAVFLDVGTGNAGWSLDGITFPAEQ